MKALISTLLATIPLWAFPQGINHWETVVQSGDSCTYLLPSAEPSATWTDIGYNDSSWGIGPMGVGYADGDDSTVIANTVSVYLRAQFNIIDTSVVQEAILSMDYDDGFVAYLNGTEIGRGYLTGTPPPYNQTAGAFHEAVLYQGIAPESFNISKATLSGILVPGVNVLAVQVHNQNITSSDMSAIPFLSLGISDTTYNYNPIPWWFIPPFEFDSSNLPIVVVNTGGQTIVDDPKVSANLGIIYNGVGIRNYLTDPFNEYSGFCGIELRGESSQGFAKKSYGVEIWDWLGNDVDASFLNFPAEEDFILYGPYSDKSLLNNVLAMKLGNDLGHYASRTRFVELVIDDDYKGVYVLMEKIKRDNDRVDIAKLDSTDVAGDSLTGGYIFRIDKGIYDGWQSNYQVFSFTDTLYFQFYYPDENTIQPEQKAYIETYVDSFESAMASSTFMDADSNHYTEFIDLRSFVDNFILNEISKNVDAYRLSTYFYKDRDSEGGKLKAGPLWDFNLAWGNGNYCGGDDSTGWEYYQCSGESPFWWDNMLGDTTFSNALRCRWEELRLTKLHTDSINDYLDSMTIYLGESQVRNFLRWPVMGIYLWPNSSWYASSTSHAEVLGYMKTFIEGRSKWLDNNIPGVAQYCELYVPPVDTTPPDTTPTISIREDPIASSSILIYPNPSSGTVHVQSMNEIQHIQVSDMIGKTVYFQRPNSHYVRLELNARLSKGVYLISVRTELGTTVRKLLIN
ncbi:TPA: T9SS type A sorting domain-containing protein [Candidatus Poribacteria bacterium]|nr:T9SS type A sorting domain-containing protein [Candidatus Poribacteria bacterium]